MAAMSSVGVEERVQVTAFVDDQAVIPEHVPGETVLSDVNTLQYTDSMRHSIISFRASAAYFMFFLEGYVQRFTWTKYLGHAESIRSIYNYYESLSTLPSYDKNVYRQAPRFYGFSGNRRFQIANKQSIFSSRSPYFWSSTHAHSSGRESGFYFENPV